MSWSEIETILMREIQSLHSPQEGWPWSREHKAPFESLVWDLGEAQMPRVYEVEQCIEGWLTTGAWPPMSDADRWWAWLRFVCALNLVILLKRCPLQPSQDQHQAVLHWLLVEWWDSHGRSSAVRSWIESKWPDS